MIDALPIVLVACSGSKLGREAAAQDLYSGDLFRKSRSYAEAFGAAWFILSAKHGLLSPATIVKPYDESLVDKTASELRAWGARVRAQFENPEGRRVVLLAGKRYRRWALGDEFSAPMQGLGIGQQKAWLKSRLSTAPTAAVHDADRIR